MPVSFAYTQVTDNEVQPLQGAFNREWFLVDQYKARSYGDGRDTLFLSGRVVSLHPTNFNWELGCPAPSGSVRRIPFLIWDSEISGRYDIVRAPGVNGGGSLGGAFVPAVNMNQPAKFTTPEFIAGSYAPGDVLVSSVAGNTNDGKILKWTGGSAMQVGVAAPNDYNRGQSSLGIPYTNLHAKSTLPFFFQVSALS